MDVDTVCTEAELADYLQGQLTAGLKLLPITQTDAKKQRQQALDDVLSALARRTPPIRESDLAAPAELKRAVQFGAEMWLRHGGLTSASPESAQAFLYVEARKRFAAEVDGLMPTLTGGVRGTAYSFGISRR